MFKFRQISVNLAGSAIPIAVILFTVPMYLNAIGAAKYGVLSLVWVVFGYFGIFDFGIARAVTHSISRMNGDTKGKAAIVWSAMAIGLIAGVVLAVIGGTAFFIWAKYQTNPTLNEIIKSLPLLCIGVPVVIISTILNAALDGEERFKLANIIQVFGAILFQLVPLFVAKYHGNSIVDLINSIIWCRVLVLTLYIAASLKVFKLTAYFGASRELIRKLLKFGSHIALVSFLDPIFSRIDQIFVAHFAGERSVAAYNIAINSAGRLSILPLAMSRSIFPKLSNSEDSGELFIAKKQVIWIWFIVCSVAILFCDLLFRLWLRNDLAPEVSGIAKIFLVGLWANCLSVLPYTALQARGRANLILRAHLIELPFYAICLYLMTNAYGALGAAAAFGVRNFLDYIVLWKMCDYPLSGHAHFALLFVALALLAFASRHIA